MYGEISGITDNLIVDFFNSSLDNHHLRRLCFADVVLLGSAGEIFWELLLSGKRCQFSPVHKLAQAIYMAHLAGLHTHARPYASWELTTGVGDASVNGCMMAGGK